MEIRDIHHVSIHHTPLGDGFWPQAAKNSRSRETKYDNHITWRGNENFYRKIIRINFNMNKMIDYHKVNNVIFYSNGVFIVRVRPQPIALYDTNLRQLEIDIKGLTLTRLGS